MTYYIGEYRVLCNRPTICSVFLYDAFSRQSKIGENETLERITVFDFSVLPILGLLYNGDTFIDVWLLVLDVVHMLMTVYFVEASVRYTLATDHHHFVGHRVTSETSVLDWSCTP